MDTYDNPWIWQGEPLLEIPEGCHDFVYHIRNHLNGMWYVGRKQFYNMRKKRGRNRRKKSESTWRGYYGSSTPLRGDVDLYGGHNFGRTVLHLHKTPGSLNYHETRELFLRDAIMDPMSYNSHVGNFRNVNDTGMIRG